MHSAWRFFNQRVARQFRTDAQFSSFAQKVRSFATKQSAPPKGLDEEPARSAAAETSINVLIFGSLATVGKVLYDGTFAFANHLISSRPNFDLEIWGNVGDNAFNQTIGRDPEIKERYGDKIQRGGKLYLTKQESRLDFFVAKFDKERPVIGSIMRLFNYVTEAELRMPFVGSNQREGMFVMNVATFDGQWIVTKVMAEDAEQCIPLKVPPPPAPVGPRGRPGGYPVPPPNLAVPTNAPHGLPSQKKSPPPPDANNTA